MSERDRRSRPPRTHCDRRCHPPAINAPSTATDTTPAGRRLTAPSRFVSARRQFVRHHRRQRLSPRPTCHRVSLRPSVRAIVFRFHRVTHVRPIRRIRALCGPCKYYFLVRFGFYFWNCFCIFPKRCRRRGNRARRRRRHFAAQRIRQKPRVSRLSGRISRQSR